MLKKIGSLVMGLGLLFSPGAAFSAEGEGASPESVNAASDSGFVSFIKSSGVVTLSMGALWQDGGKTQDATLAPGIDRTYAVTSSTLSLFNGELFLGLRRSVLSRVLGQFGLAFARSGSARLSGDVWEDNDPAFDNFRYQYNVTHTYLALKSKVLFDLGTFVTPWISVSCGVGFNSAHDFDNQGKDVSSVPSPNFVDNTTTAFSYTLGIGFQYDASKSWKIGLGYEFSGWGKSALGPAPGQTIGTGLSLPRLYTSGVLLSVTITG